VAGSVTISIMTPAIKQLEASGVVFTTHEYERGESLHDFGLEAADKLGFDPDQVFKTLLVTADGAQAVAIVPVSGKLSLKAVGKALGAKHVEMCDPAVAERVTGYVRGGISPFGQKKRLPTVLDEMATVFDLIYVSGGKRGLDLGVAPDDVVAVLNATVADIAAG
jgi:Cys-tRNA(Pro)/Cys-tRNA(Cys) deacylase